MDNFASAPVVTRVLPLDGHVLPVFAPHDNSRLPTGLTNLIGPLECDSQSPSEPYLSVHVRSLSLKEERRKFRK